MSWMRARKRFPYFLITIPTGTSVHQAAYIMATKHVRRLLVMKENNMVGIITARDLVEAYTK